MVLVFISVVISYVDHLLAYLLAVWMSSWGYVFAIEYIRSLSDRRLADTLPLHSIGCSFIFLFVFVQNLLSLT